MTAPARSEPWPELDLLRGLAVVAMIVNHAAARWYTSADSWPPAAAVTFFVGGFAPVLFFFATGFGSGLQRRRASGSAHRYGLWKKVLVLFAADAFLRWNWKSGLQPGLDFLGFIALSMLVLEPLRALRRPVPLACGLALAVLAVRFLLGPLLLSASPASDGWQALLGQATGRIAVHNLSYPPFPWLALPLLAFALGAGTRAQRARMSAKRGAVALLSLGVSAGAAALSWGLIGQGFDLNRYGTFSAVFLPAALSASALAVAIALWAVGAVGDSGRPGPLHRMLAVRGLSSLLVVPIHLAAIIALRSAGFRSPDAFAYVAVLVPVLAGSVAGAAFLARRIERAAGSHTAPTLSLAIAIGSAGTAALLASGAVEIPPLLRALAACAAQLGVCALLALPSPWPIRRPSTSRKACR